MKHVRLVFNYATSPHSLETEAAIPAVLHGLDVWLPAWRKGRAVSPSRVPATSSGIPEWITVGILRTESRSLPTRVERAQGSSFVSGSGRNKSSKLVLCREGREFSYCWVARTLGRPPSLSPPHYGSTLWVWEFLFLQLRTFKMSS